MSDPRDCGKSRYGTTADARAALRRIRRRYHRLPDVERPALHEPSSAVGLLGIMDAIALAQSGQWPLPTTVQRWLSRRPNRKREREARATRLYGDLAVLAEEVPDELRELLWSVLRRRDRQ